MLALHPSNIRDLSSIPLRKKLIYAIPDFLKHAISAGIGLFIAYIGLLNTGLISLSGTVPALPLSLLIDGRRVWNVQGLLTLLGLLITVILMIARVKGAVIIVIPIAAKVPALIVVGVLTMCSVRKIPWEDIECAVPAFMTIGIIPFAYSISDGIAAGLIIYCLLKLLCGNVREVRAEIYVIVFLFVLKYILENVPNI